MELIHGDCLVEMEKLIERGVKVDCVITDPPYGMSFQSGHRKEKYEVIINDDLQEDQLFDFLKNAFTKTNQLQKNDSFLISFMGWSTIPIFNKALQEYEIKSMPIWVKNNLGLGFYTRPQYEPMYLCMKGNPKPPKNAISDVLLFDKVHTTIHSCEKPIKLMERLIETFTKEGETILDPFMGSGTTGVACKNLNRNFIGIELDEHYYNVAKNRIESDANNYTETKDMKQISVFDL